MALQLGCLINWLAGGPSLWYSMHAYIHLFIQSSTILAIHDSIHYTTLPITKNLEIQQSKHYPPYLPTITLRYDKIVCHIPISKTM